MAGAREPGLQQRPVGRECKERQPDRDREQTEQPQRLARLRRRTEALRDVQRQHEAGEHIHRDVDEQRVPPGRKARDQMRVGIARQQGGLEEHQRNRPDRGGAAELRQHHLGEHRLHGEQQRRADEDGRDESREQHTEGCGFSRLCVGGRGLGGHAIICGAGRAAIPADLSLRDLSRALSCACATHHADKQCCCRFRSRRRHAPIPIALVLSRAGPEPAQVVRRRRRRRARPR